MLSETRDLQEASSCAACAKASPGVYQRYHGFVTAPGTLIAAGNALLPVVANSARLIRRRLSLRRGERA